MHGNDSVKTFTCIETFSFVLPTMEDGDDGTTATEKPLDAQQIFAIIVAIVVFFVIIIDRIIAGEYYDLG